MIIENLISNFDELLKTTEEIWFAVALIKESTFDYVQNTINKECKQNYLVGIDLPTHPQVLRKMQSNQQIMSFKSGICKSDFNFHPKVYLFKENNCYTAFIGSSNLTDGGLENNIELNYKITNQKDCLTILNWFDNLYEQSYPLSEENILEYEAQFDAIAESEQKLIKRRKLIKLRKPSFNATNTNTIDLIDFSDRYFKKKHHLAFREKLWKDTSSQANNERYDAKERFLELNEEIFFRFKDYNLVNLHHNVKNHIVSMHYHLDGASSQNLKAMWLSYGKSQEEIKKYRELFPKVPNKKLSDEDDKMSFINHARLQIRIDINSIGIWLLFGKNNDGSLFDRKNFFDKMISNTYQEDFFKKIIYLPQEYWIRVNDIQRNCDTFVDKNELYQFCKKDNSKKYFIIGRDYKITDNEMSKENLPIETLKVFKLLYPLYDMMIKKI